MKTLAKCSKWAHYPLAAWLVLARVVACDFGCSSGSTRTRKVATLLTTRKPRTIGKVLVSPPPQCSHFKFTLLPPIRSLGSVRIVTWSIHTLCTISRTFPSCCQICDQTIIYYVTIKSMWLSHTIWGYFTTIPWIFIRSPIWMRVVEYLPNCTINISIMTPYD